MENTLTTREKLNLAFQQLHGENYMTDCFCCDYGISNGLYENEESEQEALSKGHCRRMGWILSEMGVLHGRYETFWFGRHAVVYFDYNGRPCGLGVANADKLNNEPMRPDLDWQAFIDEVVSLVGE